MVAGSNLGWGYFAPRFTQLSIPPGLVDEYKLRLRRQRQVWLIPIADERVGVQVKLWNPLRTRVIPGRFCGGDSLRRGAISSVSTFTFTLVSSKRQWKSRFEFIKRQNSSNRPAFCCFIFCRSRIRDGLQTAVTTYSGCVQQSFGSSFLVEWVRAYSYILTTPEPARGWKVQKVHVIVVR